MNTRHALSAAFALCLLPGVARAADEGWQWVGGPYLWASSVTTDLRDDAEPVPSTTSFESILSKIDMAFQGHVEGQGDRFGVLADLTYLSLGDGKERTVYTTDSSLDTMLFELAGVWNVEPARYEGLDVIAGMRHINADLSVDLEPTGPGVVFPPVNVHFDQSFTDFMLGLRYTAPVSEKWKVITRVDGAWGDTDGTVNGSLMAARKFSNGSFLFGYRYMQVKLADGDRSVKLTLNGPVLAYAFGF